MIKPEINSNIGEARALLARARAAALDVEPLLDIAGGIVEASVRERFRSGHGPGGIPWLPSNRQRYAARPDARGKGAIGPNPGGRTLVNTGGLESSLSYVVSKNKVTIGFIANTQSAKFAYVHQFGATITPRTAPFLVFRGPDGHLVYTRRVVIPARPMLGIDDNDRKDLLEAWTDHLTQELGQK